MAAVADTGDRTGGDRSWERRVVVDPLTDDLWQTLVSQHPSDVFHSPRWLQVLATTYGFEPQAVVLLDGASRPVAGVAYCAIEGLPTRRIATPPFSDFCDPIVSNEAQWNQLLDALAEQECTITVRSLHNDIPVSSERMTLVNQAAWHGLDLAPDLDDIWAGLSGSARRAVRKAEKQGVVVRAATDVHELRAFFELHLRVRKYKYRLLAQPYRFFENIWAEFLDRGHGSLMLAFHDEKLLGGVLFLEWKDTAYYKFNASDASLVEVRPNDLIVWKAIEAAKTKGLAQLDFGLSDMDQEGLIRYKRKYASAEKTISFVRHEPAAAPASAAAAQIREILPALTDLFTDESVPDSVTEQAGDLLYRLFG